MNRISALCALVLSCVALAPAVAKTLPCGRPDNTQPETGRETVVYVTTQWTASCPGSKRGWWDYMVKSWYNNLTSTKEHGNRAWEKDGFFQNRSPGDRESDYTDPALLSCGNDLAHDRPDDVDAVLIALHGRKGGPENRFRGTVRLDEPHPDCNCELGQEHIRYGTGDLEFLTLSACHSMCQAHWQRWHESYDRQNGIHQVHGFHGIMWIGKDYRRNYKHFADDAFDYGMAYAWLDNLYIRRINGRDDQCPVTHTVGNDWPDILLRAGLEQSDWTCTDPGFFNWWGVLYIRGCDPKGDPPLP